MIFLSLLLTIIPFPFLKQLQEIRILSVSLLFSTQTSSSVLLSISRFSCRALSNIPIVIQTFLQLYPPLFSILGHGCNGSCSPRTQICLSGEQELFHFHLCVNSRYHKKNCRCMECLLCARHYLKWFSCTFIDSSQKPAQAMLLSPFIRQEA